MKRPNAISVLAFTLFMSMMVSAQAQTIDFETGGFIDTGEFVITSDNSTPSAIDDFGFTSNVYGWCAENCEGLSTLTLQRADNQPFSVSSVDAGFLGTTTDANPLVVTGNLNGGGTVVENLTLTTTPPQLTTYPLSGFVNVLSITFSKADAAAGEDDGLADAAIDNITLSPTPAAPATPVPALPLFGLLTLGGLVGLFGLRKLKK